MSSIEQSDDDRQATHGGLRRWHVITNATPARKTLWAAIADEARKRAEGHGLKIHAVRPAPPASTA